MPRPSTNPEKVGLYLYLPKELNTKLKALAKQDKRSMQNVALKYVTKAIDRDFNKIFGVPSNEL